MPAKHYSEKDFVITSTEDGNEYGYCRKCTADMQRFKSDRILRHYHSHGNYRRVKAPVITEVKYTSKDVTKEVMDLLKF